MIAGASARGGGTGAVAGGAPTLGSTFTSTHGVGVVAHGHTAGLGTTTEVAALAGLAEATQSVVGVADAADHSLALDADAPDFAGGQGERRVVVFLVGQTGAHA